MIQCNVTRYEYVGRIQQIKIGQKKHEWQVPKSILFINTTSAIVSDISECKRVNSTVSCVFKNFYSDYNSKYFYLLLHEALSHIVLCMEKMSSIYRIKIARSENLKNEETCLQNIVSNSLVNVQRLLPSLNWISSFIRFDLCRCGRQQGISLIRCSSQLLSWMSINESHWTSVTLTPRISSSP